MPNTRSLFGALIVALALVPSGKLMAQRSDADWLDDCRSEGGDRYDRREAYCEIRQTGRAALDPTSRWMAFAMEASRSLGGIATAWRFAPAFA